MSTLKHSGDLKYLEDEKWKRIKDPSLIDKCDVLKLVPPGSVFVTMSDEWVSYLIGIFGMLMYFPKALKSGFRVCFSHVGFYLGSGENLVIDANAKGVTKNHLDKLLEDNHKLKVYRNKNLTVEQLQLLKDWCYSKLGKKYDWRAFANFIFNYIGEEKDAYICTEFVLNGLKDVELPYDKSWKKLSNVHPIEFVNFFESNYGEKEGWDLILSWGY